MKNYTEDFFLAEAWNFYKENDYCPTTKDFVWSKSACRKFGSWDVLLKKSGIFTNVQQRFLKKKIIVSENRKKFWNELIWLTHNPDWYLHRETLKRVKLLIKQCEQCDKELEFLNSLQSNDISVLLKCLKKEFN
ncbi:hypothetical protein [Enterococcus faecalis]|uniref:hypothetical protein n=1 Tax=Enterococcus faecalis TaxID=1351 RepID=UPI002FBED706